MSLWSSSTLIITALLLQKYDQFSGPLSLLLGCYITVDSFFHNLYVMYKSKHFIGVDISKDTFDVWDLSTNKHHRFNNDLKGFRLFYKLVKIDTHCAMESTGCYYQQFALFLYEKQVDVSVLNPLSVKRFIQMKLKQNKTDKSDARMIALYASEQPLKLWIPEPEYIEKSKQLQKVIVLYLKQNTSLKNHIQALESRGVKMGKIITSLKRQLRQVNNEIKLLEAEIEKLIKDNDGELLSNLTTIPGVGKKTATYLIIMSNGFRNFDNYRQVSAFIGLAPTERSSGTSINGSSRISKRGNPNMRNHLFMCSFTACQCNPQCQALYQRIVNKGKSKKLALIAVCNKLIKQAFAISKSGLAYDPNYKSCLSVQ